MRIKDAIAASAVLICFFAAQADAQTNCGPIDAITAKGGVLHPDVLIKLEDPLACIVDRLPNYFEVVSNEKLTFNDPRVRTYLSLTSAAISLVEKQGGDYAQINRFRELDSIDVARTLAAGSRHTDRNVRINSARLFSNVIDDETLCVALDYLRADVDESKIDSHTIRGRANLLGVIKPAASWVGIESERAIREVVESIRTEVERLSARQRKNLANTERLLTDVQFELVEGEPHNVPDEKLEDCKNYKFKFWSNGADFYNKL